MPSFIAEKPLNSGRVFWLDQGSLIQEIHTVARRVGEANENALKIVLFGSLAERTGVLGSDADVLLVLKESDKPFLERIEEWSEKFSLDFRVEVFPYTAKELNNPLVQEAMKRGITVFER